MFENFCATTHNVWPVRKNLKRNLTGSASESRQTGRLDRNQLFQTPRHFLRIFPAVKRRDPKITFSLRAETRARRDDHIQFAQHPVEQLPACQTVRCFHPDVRRVDSSESLKASVTRRVAEDFGISHVMID